MKKNILSFGQELNRTEQKQINGGGRPFLGSVCSNSCPGWNYNGSNVPCGTYIGGFGSECIQCIDPFSGVSGYECRIFSA